MSYSIKFKAKLEDSELYLPIIGTIANTTYNVKDMIIAATGLEAWTTNTNLGLVKDVIVAIDNGYSALVLSPTDYIQYEDINGWGTVRSTRDFFKTILEKWANLITLSPEFSEIATFWVE